MIIFVSSIHLFAQQDTTYFNSLTLALKTPGKVYKLALHGRNLSADDLEQMYKFVNLEELDVYNAGLWHFNEVVLIPHLKKLHISNSDLRDLPANLGNLKSLELLDLSHNVSIKELPASISQLTNLKTLRISRMDSLKEIPAFIGDLTSLTELELEINQYCQVPVSIGNLKNLIKLELRGEDNYSIPAEIGNLTKLESLKVFNRGKALMLPARIGGLSSLKTLTFGGIIGTLPPQFGDLLNLRFLKIEGQIRTLPAEISKLSNLEELGIANSGEPFVFPASIGKLSGLKILKLESNISPEVPLEFGDLNIEYLELHYTTLSTLPAAFCKLKKLKTLQLTRNEEFNGFSINMSRLEALETLNIAAHPKTDFATLGYFVNCKNLRTINIAESSVKELPENFDQFSITHLGLYYVLMSEKINWSKIIKTVSKLKPLTYLGLSGSFSNLETLPAALSSLQKIDTLSLSNNYTSVSDLKILSTIAIQRLDLSNCNLTKIPSNINLLKNISEIDLSLNELQSIDPVITQLDHLEKLDLHKQDRFHSDSDDFYTLTDISALSQMKNLQQLNLSANPKIEAQISVLKEQLKNCTLVY